jgi:N-acetylglutamate synthase-like GNAT family acetyltransferase
MQFNITIREATNHDSAGILTLIFDIWRNEYHFAVNKENFPDLHSIEEFYLHRGGLFLIAILNSKIIGTIACDKLSSGTYVLKRMFVEKPFRKIGVGQKLFDELMKRKFCSDKKCCLYLSTKDSLAIAAKQFYLKNGFQIISRKCLPLEFPYFYEDDLFMVKQIPSISKQLEN